MRITLLEEYAGKKAGETFDLTDDGKANKLITAGIAKAAPALDTTLVDAETKSAWRELGREIAAGLVANQQQNGNGGLPAGTIESVPTELKGLSVFGSTGGFLHAIKDAASAQPEHDTVEKMGAWRDMQRKAGVFDPITKAPSGNFEGNDPDGGALVIPEFSQAIYERSQLEENFLADADVLTVRGNMMTIPALDDYSRASGSRWGGITSRWASEGGDVSTASKPTFRQMDLKLHKLYVFCYVTDELLNDSPFALESYVSKYSGKELAFRFNDVMISGTGAGQPLGINNSPAKITVSAEPGQAAATIYTQNIEKMWMRLNAYCRSDAVWLINQDCEATLQSMALPVGVAGVPTYLPVGGVSSPSYATLKGRPVKVVEFCETLGTEGDIILTSWSHYKAITKGGVKSDVSMHVRFLYGEMAYRFTARMDGQPAWDKPLTPYKGSTTTSSIVTLATRS